MRDKLFILIVMGFISMFLLSIIIRAPKEVSVIENRFLTKIPFLVKADLLSGQYQKELESALSDQFLLNETIKIYYNVVKKTTISPFKKMIKVLLRPNNLFPRGKGVYELNDSDYLVYLPINIDDKVILGLENFTKQVNAFQKNNSDIKVFVYKINTDHDYLQLEVIDTHFKENLNFNISYMSSVKTKSINDYKKYFYKTDHHWNNRGSYEGYKDIINLLLNNEAYKQYEVEKCFSDIKFRGSKAMTIVDFSLYDNFCVYKFNLSQYITKINGEIKAYGQNKKYFTVQYSLDKGVNHYSAFYGNDVGEIQYNFLDNISKDNLLILSNSFSNPINNLIASHFHNTYIVDLRHYRREMGVDFIINDYIKEKNIDRVLFLGNINFYTSLEFMSE